MQKLTEEDILDLIFDPNQGTAFSGTAKAAVVGACAIEGPPQVQSLEREAIQAAEAGEYPRALELLNQAIALDPNWASAYNNRAQVRQLMGDVGGAEADVEVAVVLGGPGLPAALAQRAALRRRAGLDPLPDLTAAAQLGNTWARHQAALLNPYARMCNAMLTEVMKNPKFE